jgi:hypothetical protein
MAQDVYPSSNRFAVGQVISTSIAIFLRNLVPFTVITGIVGIPYILVSLLGGSSLDTSAIERTGQLPPGFWGMVAVGALVSTLTYSLTQAAIVYGTVQDLRGQRASFGDCLSRGFAVLPRVLFAAILAGIGIGIGTMLLVIPGLILMVMWWVLVPSVVVEGVGVDKAFGRSGDLTRGHRWGIFGLLVLVWVVQWLVSLLVGMVAVALGGVFLQIANIVLELAFTAFACVLSAVGYYYLRAEKEGVIIDDIARVFD